ncbi:hypothetical protein Vafri_20409, partial [Volvox africanus]
MPSIFALLSRPTAVGSRVLTKGSYNVADGDGTAAEPQEVKPVQLAHVHAHKILLLLLDVSIRAAAVFGVMVLPPPPPPHPPPHTVATAAAAVVHFFDQCCVGLQVRCRQHQCAPVDVGDDYVVADRRCGDSHQPHAAAQLQNQCPLGSKLVTAASLRQQPIKQKTGATPYLPPAPSPLHPRSQHRRHYI